VPRGASIDVPKGVSVEVPVEVVASSCSHSPPGERALQPAAPRAPTPEVGIAPLVVLPSLPKFEPPVFSSPLPVPESPDVSPLDALMPSRQAPTCNDPGEIRDCSSFFLWPQERARETNRPCEPSPCREQDECMDSSQVSAEIPRRSPGRDGAEASLLPLQRRSGAVAVEQDERMDRSDVSPESPRRSPGRDDVQDECMDRSDVSPESSRRSPGRDDVQAGSGEAIGQLTILVGRTSPGSPPLLSGDASQDGDSLPSLAHQARLRLQSPTRSPKPVLVRKGYKMTIDVDAACSGMSPGSISSYRSPEPALRRKGRKMTIDLDAACSERSECVSPGSICSYSSSSGVGDFSDDDCGGSRHGKHVRSKTPSPSRVISCNDDGGGRVIVDCGDEGDRGGLWCGRSSADPTLRAVRVATGGADGTCDADAADLLSPHSAAMALMAPAAALVPCPLRWSSGWDEWDGPVANDASLGPSPGLRVFEFLSPLPGAAASAIASTATVDDGVCVVVTSAGASTAAADMHNFDWSPEVVKRVICDPGSSDEALRAAAAAVASAHGWPTGGSGCLTGTHGSTGGCGTPPDSAMPPQVGTLSSPLLIAESPGISPCPCGRSASDYHLEARPRTTPTRRLGGSSAKRARGVPRFSWIDVQATTP